MTSYSPPLWMWRGWGRVCFLVLYLIVLQLPLAESLQGFVAHHAMDGDGTVFVWFLYLPVYEVIAKTYAVGILLGIAVKDGANPCPVEGRKTHGAWLARGVAYAPLQLEVPHPLARLAYGAHLGMSSRIVVGRHTVGTCCHHLAILHYHGTERSASVLHILHAQVYCHLHEPAVSIRYLCHRLSFIILVTIQRYEKNIILPYPKPVLQVYSRQHGLKSLILGIGKRKMNPFTSKNLKTSTPASRKASRETDYI